MSNILVIFGAAIRPDGKPSGTLRRRVWGAHRFGTRLDEPFYLVTGGVGRHGPPEATVMRAQLLGYGVSEERIIVEDQGTDTLSSAILCWRILRDRDQSTAVYVCSSPFHIPRCRLLLRILGLRTAAARMPGDRHPLGTVKWLYYVLREAAALPYDAIVMTLRRPFL